MATLQDLRAHFGAASDDEAIRKAAERFRIDPVEVAREVGYDLGGKWGNRLGASVDSYQANMYGLGEAITGSDWMRRQRQSNEAAAGLQREIARSQGAVSSYKDVDSIGDGLDYLGGLAVDSLPYAAEALLGGFGAARLAGRGLQGAIQAGRAADASVDAVRAGQVAERALATRSTLGGVAASYPSAVGDILSNQREASGDGQVDLLSAAVGGIPYAALNAVGIEGALARRSLARGVGEGGAVRRLGRSIGLGMVTEGASETGQEMVNQGFGRMAVDPNAGLFDADALERYGESFVGGAALGGAFGSVGGWRQSQEYVDHQRLQGAREREQMAIEVAEKQRELDLLGGRQAPQWGTSLGFDPAPVAPLDPRLQVDPRLGDVSPQWETSLGAGAGPTADGVPAAGLYSAIDDPATTTGRRRDTTSTQIPAVDGLPTSLGNIVADQYGLAATTPTGADALYGEQNGDPGLIEARRRYEERRRQQEDERRRQDEAQRRYEAKRADAFNTFEATTPEDQKRVRQPAIDALAAVRDLVDTGRLGVAESDAVIGELRGAVQAGDNRTINRILKEAKDRASQQPVVPGTTGTPGGPVAGEGDQSGRSPGAARPVAGGGVAEPDVGAELADAGGEANPALAGTGAVGTARARPTELTDQEIEALAQASRPITESRKATASRRNAASAELDQFLVDAYEKGVAVGKPLTADQMAAAATERGFTNKQGKPISRQSVTERLKANGIQLNDANQTALDLDTVSQSELIGEVTGEDADTTLGGAGFRAASSAADTAQDELGTSGGFSTTVIDEDGRPVRDADAAERAAKKAEQLSSIVGQIINAKTPDQLKKAAGRFRAEDSGLSQSEVAELEKILADATKSVVSGEAKLREDLQEARATLEDPTSGDTGRQRLLQAARAAARENLRLLDSEAVLNYWGPAAALWDENKRAGQPVFAQLPGAAKLHWLRTLADVDEKSQSSVTSAVEEFENELTKINFNDRAFKPISEAAERSFRAAGAVLRRQRTGTATDAVGDRPANDAGVSEEAPADGALPVVGDGTRAQGVTIERKGAKAPKVRDYAHLSGVELTDTIEVDGASTVMRLKADVELKRLDKLEGDLKAIIDCVKGGR